MDTDFLTERAYEVLIGKAGDVSEFLRADIGAASRLYPNEDAYLGAMHHFVSQIADFPDDYLDRWDLLDEVDAGDFGFKAKKLADSIMNVIQTSADKRGPAGI